jgi:hypothetical protein
MPLDNNHTDFSHRYDPSEQEPPRTGSITSRPVDTPHQRALRQKAKKRQQKTLVYLGPIAEDWAIACQKAHPMGFLLACAIRLRSTMRGGQPVPVGQALANHLGISRDQRKRALAALEAAGLIQVERKPGCAPRVVVVERTPSGFIKPKKRGSSSAGSATLRR